MDRERLKEVHQTDLTESRINEDFVDWLKNKGPSWLLIILVCVTGYLAMVRWRQHRLRKVDEAWAALNDAPLPSSKEDVAAAHAGVFAVPQIALEQAASQLLRSVQSGTAIDLAAGTESTGDDAALSEEQRTQYLDRADGIFQRILEGDGKIGADDGSLGMTLHAVQAYNGRAAVAEARGDAEQARRFYDQAAERAEQHYAALAEQARERQRTIEANVAPVTLPTTADLANRPPPDLPVQSAAMEPSLRDLLLPPDDGEG
jgi:tetratricopeptide (TPR) repeat protein